MDIYIIQLIALPVLALMVFGAKSTWKLVRNLIPGIDSPEGFVFTLIIFILVFVIAAPIMGIINIIKLIVTGRRKPQI